LGTEDVAHQVDAEDLVPARCARLLDLLVFADAGVVDEDVEAPELLRSAVDEVEACGLATDVSLREGNRSAGGLQLACHSLAALTIAIAECHARTLGEETPDRRLADPRCSARHRCDLAVEPSHLRHPSFACETLIHDTSYPSGERCPKRSGSIARGSCAVTKSERYDVSRPHERLGAGRLSVAIHAGLDRLQFCNDCRVGDLPEPGHLFPLPDGGLVKHVQRSEIE